MKEMKVNIFVRVGDKVYRLEELTPEQRKTLSKNLNEQASKVPLRLKEE